LGKKIRFFSERRLPRFRLRSPQTTQISADDADYKNTGPQIAPYMALLIAPMATQIKEDVVY
jgi:hypothetical protein